MDKLIRTYSIGRQPTWQYRYQTFSRTTQFCYVHDGETFMMERITSQGRLITPNSDWDRSELKVVIYAEAGTLELVHHHVDTECPYPRRFYARVAGKIYGVDGSCSYDMFIAYLAAGRKYHEHAGNVYIAATAWRFKYPGDCLVVCHE